MLLVKQSLPLILLMVCSATLSAQDYLPVTRPMCNDPVPCPSVNNSNSEPTGHLEKAQSSTDGRSTFRTSVSDSYQTSGTLYPTVPQRTESPVVMPVAYEASHSPDTSESLTAEKNTRAHRPLPPPSHMGSKRSSKIGSGALPSVSTVTGALAVVLGMFFLLAWTMRRMTPGRSTLLPGEAFEVLGRAPLMGRQHAHLVRCGNKLLLISLVAGSAKTLTEITDPEEVERLADLCRRGTFRQTKAAFQRAIDHVTRQQTIKRPPIDDMETNLQVSQGNTLAGRESWENFHV